LILSISVAEKVWRLIKVWAAEVRLARDKTMTHKRLRVAFISFAKSNEGEWHPQAQHRARAVAFAPVS
jgi:hypothetical protein